MAAARCTLPWASSSMSRVKFSYRSEKLRRFMADFGNFRAEKSNRENA